MQKIKQDLNSSRSFPLTKNGRVEKNPHTQQAKLTNDLIEKSVNLALAEEWGSNVFKKGSSLMRNKGLCHQNAQRLNTSTKGWLDNYDSKKKAAYAR